MSRDDFKAARIEVQALRELAREHGALVHRHVFEHDYYTDVYWTSLILGVFVHVVMTVLPGRTLVKVSIDGTGDETVILPLGVTDEDGDLTDLSVRGWLKAWRQLKTQPDGGEFLAFTMFGGGFFTAFDFGEASESLSWADATLNADEFGHLTAVDMDGEPVEDDEDVANAVELVNRIASESARNAVVEALNNHFPEMTAGALRGVEWARGSFTVMVDGADPERDAMSHPFVTSISGVGSWR